MRQSAPECCWEGTSLFAFFGMQLVVWQVECAQSGCGSFLHATTTLLILRMMKCKLLLDGLRAQQSCIVLVDTFCESE